VKKWPTASRWPSAEKAMERILSPSGPT
jgi:hypothetical protein